LKNDANIDDPDGLGRGRCFQLDMGWQKNWAVVRKFASGYVARFSEITKVLLKHAPVARGPV
jgi:hypothetical protein